MTEIPAVSKWARIGFALAALILVADQATKLFFQHVVDLIEIKRIAVLPVFSFTHVWNKGISFGLLQAESGVGKWILVLFALGVSVMVGRWLLRADRALPAIALGLILGGALGNVIDRALYGKVFDFLDFSGLGFPWVFNVADAGISVGVAVLVYDMIFAKRHDETNA